MKQKSAKTSINILSYIDSLYGAHYDSWSSNTVFACLHILSLPPKYPSLFWPLLTHDSVQFSCRSVVSDSLQPHELQNSRPPSNHQLPESTQTHVHWVGDAIPPSHPLPSPSPAFSLSWPQSLFQLNMWKCWNYSTMISCEFTTALNVTTVIIYTYMCVRAHSL